MLAQLKIIVLFKEAIKLALFLVYFSICGFDCGFKMAGKKKRSSETYQSIVIPRNAGYSM